MPHSYEVLVRRLRPANDLRGAAAPGRRHARGGVPLPAVRARRGDAHQSHGDSARRVAGRADRRPHDPRPTNGDGAEDGGGHFPTWSDDAQERLARVPGFVRGMVKRIYSEYARDRGIAVVTTAVMDAARTELGLEGM